MVQIDYATEPRRGWKRPVILSLSVTIIFVGCIFLARYLEPIIRWRIPFLREQRACLNWTGPAGQIAYSEDPAEAQRLSGGHTTGPGFTTLYDPDKKQIIGYYSVADVLSGMNYPESGFMMVDKRDAVLFLHSRKAKGCDARLVCVRVDNFFALRAGRPEVYASPMMSALECTVVQQGGIRAAPKILQHFTWSDPMFGAATPRPTRIFFGQPDPVDDSKFSILFQTPTATKVIEGCLLPDDTLKFQIVAGPNAMTPRAPSTTR